MLNRVDTEIYILHTVLVKFHIYHMFLPKTYDKKVAEINSP